MSAAAGTASISSRTCPTTRTEAVAGRRSRAGVHGRPTHRPVVGASTRTGLHPAQGKSPSRPAVDLQVQLGSRPDRLQASPRAFAGDKDKGLLICTWPKGGRPPAVMLYSDEVWTGIEYQVAAHMIYEGMIEEGLAIVRAPATATTAFPAPPSAAILGTRSNAAATTRGRCRVGRCSWPPRVSISTARVGALEFAPMRDAGAVQVVLRRPGRLGHLEQMRTGGSGSGTKSASSKGDCLCPPCGYRLRPGFRRSSRALPTICQPA